MNEFERMLRQWRNQIRKWWASTSSKKEEPQATRHKMCPSCGMFNEPDAGVCEYCGAVLKVQHQRTVSASGNEIAGPFLNPVKTVLTACVVLFLVTMYLTSKDADFQGFLSPSGAANYAFGSNAFYWTFSRGELWRLLTYNFLHGGLMHIFFNMSALAQLGFFTWVNFGTRRFWLITLFCGAMGGVASAMGDLVLPPAPSVGFSAALFAYLGANYMFFRQEGHFSFADRFKKYMIWGNVICIALTFLGIMRIDNLAHLGGMFAGMGVAWLFRFKAFARVAPKVENAIVGLCVLGLAWGLFEIVQNIEAGAYLLRYHGYRG